VVAVVVVQVFDKTMTLIWLELAVKKIAAAAVAAVQNDVAAVAVAS